MTQTATFTRQKYLNGECTHAEYYGQFVSTDTTDLISDIFSKEKLLATYKEDKNFNGIPLVVWDGIAVRLWVSQKLTRAGDTSTLSGRVCIAKEAARQIIAKYI